MAEQNPEQEAQTATAIEEVTVGSRDREGVEVAESTEFGGGRQGGRIGGENSGGDGEGDMLILSPVSLFCYFTINIGVLK